MKKILLGFAAIATLASCAKNEVMDNPADDANRDLNRISFQATTGSATRAATSELKDLQDLADGFQVYGIAKFDGTAESYFTDQANTDGVNNYKYDGTTSTWDWKTPSGTDKNWPEPGDAKYPLQFFAAYPAIGSLAWSAPTNAFTAEATVENQEDRLAAVVSIADKPMTGTAPLDFKHILSAIQFKLMSSPNYIVNIKEISIQNITATRTFDYSKGEWSALTLDQDNSYIYFQSKDAASVQALTFDGTTPAVAKEILSGNITAQAPSATAGPLMFAPQTGAPTNSANFAAAAAAWVTGGKSGSFPDVNAIAALAEGAYIQVVYNMIDNTDTQNPKYLIGAQGKYIRVFFPLDLNSNEWEMSKRYTYTLYLGTPDASNGTIIDPGYTEEDPSTPGTGGDLDNPAVDPGETVTKGKITFKVGVTDWVGSESDIK